MLRTLLIGLLAIALTLIACHPRQTNTPEPSETQIIMDHPFPFQVTDNNGQFTILAALESDALFTTYYPFFEKHGYEGNGYCWEGHITQILEKKDKELLNHIEFDPEAGGFYAYADSKENRARFVNLLSPIFSDLAQLEAFVTSADKGRIDD